MLANINLTNYKTHYTGYDLITKPAKFTNKIALDLLSNELSKSIPKRKVFDWMAKVKVMCKKYGIEPKRLPINSEHPGSLTEKELLLTFSEIMNPIIDTLKAKNVNFMA